MNLIYLAIIRAVGYLMRKFCHNYSSPDSFTECLRHKVVVSNTIGVIFLAIGVVCLMFHVYVIISYNFRVDYHKEPVQYLFATLSIYEACTCIVYIGSFFTTNLPYGQSTGASLIASVIHFTMAAFNIRSAYFVALLLAVNRYFSIVKIRYYFYLFTKWKIRFYFLIILLVNSLINICSFFIHVAIVHRHYENESITDGKHGDLSAVVAAKMDRQLEHSDYLRRYMTAYFIVYLQTFPSQKDFDREYSWFHVLYLVETSILLIPLFIVIIAVIIIYWRIHRNKSELISWKVELNKIPYEVSADDEEGRPLILTNVFDYSIEIERMYLKSVNVSVVVTLVFFVIHYALTWWLTYKKAPDFCKYFHGYTYDCELTKLIYPFDPVIFPAIVNPFVFLLNNEDFRIKLKRPLRPLKRQTQHLLQQWRGVCASTFGTSRSNKQKPSERK